MIAWCLALSNIHGTVTVPSDWLMSFHTPADWVQTLSFVDGFEVKQSTCPGAAGMGLFATKDYKAKDELISFYGYWAPTKFNNLLQKDEGVYTFVLPEEWPEHIRDNLLFVAGAACLANKINTCA